MKSFIKKNLRLVYNLTYILLYHPFFMLTRVRNRKTIIKNLKRYKDIHFGERCFIIATGPSLRVEDIKKIQNEYLFGVNALCKIFKENDFTTDYYIVTDHRVYGKVFQDIDKNVNKRLKKENIFISDWIGSRHKVNVEVPSEYVKLPINPINRFIKNWKKRRYPNDLCKNCYDGHTVVFIAIQVAVHMGFKEIYLIGTDSNYETEKKYSVNHGIKTKAMAGIEMINDYKVAQKFLERKNIKIFNATRGGMLEVFERVNIDNFVAKLE